MRNNPRHERRIEMTEYMANRELKKCAENVRSEHARTRATDSGAPVVRFIFRALLLATWGVAVYNVAVSVLS